MGMSMVSCLEGEGAIQWQNMSMCDYLSRSAIFFFLLSLSLSFSLISFSPYLLVCVRVSSALNVEVES